MSELLKIPDFFFPSLFQNKIDKIYEIRAFYLEGDFSCIAMFSQQNEQSQTDFRKYSYSNPVREIPYKLPKQIETMLKQLLKELNLNCASIDLIKSTTGQYVFLEINTLGQFGMVSNPGNFYLEKKIAQLLIKYHDESKKYQAENQA